MPKFSYPPLERRFWESVDKRGPDECWPWLGTKTHNGYGTIGSKGKTLRAHRVSWEIANDRPVPEGLHVCHSCDNPPCVNPAHLWAGTQGDNNRDATAKGRGFRKPLTHCPKGHPIEMRQGSSRKKRCRTCYNEYQLKWYHAHKPSLSREEIKE